MYFQIALVVKSYLIKNHWTNPNGWLKNKKTKNVLKQTNEDSLARNSHIVGKLEKQGGDFEARKIQPC